MVPVEESEIVLLHWVNSNDNFGDAISPLIVRHVAGVEPRYTSGDIAEPHLFAIGSMIQVANPFTVVWGTGTLHWHIHVNRHADIRMVRGPLTYAAVRASGVKCPDIWGDPAAFIRELFPPQSSPSRDWCIVPHYREAPLPDVPGVAVVSPLLPPEEFCRQLCQHRFVLSSSLHGLIAAHAFGLKAAWIKLSNHPLGDDTKFRDYLLSQNLCPEPVPLPHVDQRSIQACRWHLTEADFDLDRMRLHFPFDLAGS